MPVGTAAARFTMFVRTTGTSTRIVVMLAILLGGGLSTDAAGPPPVPRKTREELVREWDLNSDGKIDPGEAEVAASRMRRERAQLRLNSGIDPLTGLPRGEELEEPVADEPPETDAATDESPPADEAAAEAVDTAEPPLPGTRVPRPQVSGTGAVAPQPQANTARGMGTGTRAAADAKRQVLMGGARAGGLPARPGYGAGIPTAPLNAGLPIGPRAGAAPAQRPRGGLVPAVRPAPVAPPRRSTGPGQAYDPY